LDCAGFEFYFRATQRAVAVGGGYEQSLRTGRACGSCGAVNPETRLAWSHAKEAAAAVGLAKSEYYPLLALNAAAQSARLPEQVPWTAQKLGYMDLEGQELCPMATLEWVLLDFGRRAADVRAARARLLAANLGFNARHQVIVFKVQSAFYQLSSLIAASTPPKRLWILR